MKKMLMAVIAMMMTISVSAQFYIYCSDGSVIKVDSISMVAPEENTDPYNGYEYVDLGLSVKWATMNVGAFYSEDYGDYFAWGETEPKDFYAWSTYKWSNGSFDTQTKYCTNSVYGTVDNKTELELSDDAARANWKGVWRMPTLKEQDELREKCTWKWTIQNGTYGYTVTGPNGNSIFLPAAGYRGDVSVYDEGTGGFYWTSSLFAEYPDFAWRMYFYSDIVGRNYESREYGFTIRPVCP